MKKAYSAVCIEWVPIAAVDILTGSNGEDIINLNEIAL